MAEVTKCKLDVNNKDSSGYTLLHKVVIKEVNPYHLPTPARVEETDVNNLKLLLKFHPDLNIINALTSEGENILHLAIKNERSLEMVKIITKALLGHDVDINLADKKGYTAFHYAISPISFNYQQKNHSQNYQYLDFNFKFTDAAIVQHLIEKGSRIEIVDKNGYSPLLLAVVMQRTDYVRVLLEHKDKLSEGALEKTVNTFFCQKALGYNTFVQYPPKEYYDITPLWIAAQENNNEMVQLLVQAGANINAVNGNTCQNNQYHQMTPLQLSVSSRNFKMAELLVNAGANINTANGNTCQNNQYHQRTPLQLSVSNSSFKMAELLVNAGANVNTVRDGENLLQKIIRMYSLQKQATEEETQIAKLLIDSGIDINAKLQGEDTLHLALKYNKHDIVTAILEKGLDTL